ncbi:ABC-2 family transporter protein [Oceanobacillus limi]|uniref:ABC-2 family transporter protein n=1 Tax=Oceanobacillus limi TaxID=930131 RepID=A0A1I0FN84_9BACI|nr:ABC-2 transporter permease [Oceanobacillus limi]SET59793.1 ABC-2 family transporter protein [Oceanobacillus limi]
MVSLVKRDFIALKNAILTALCLIPIGYLIHLPPIYTTVGLILPVLIIGSFYVDDRANINRFTLSLPINKDFIVKGRYLLFFTVWIGIIFYQAMVGQLIETFSTLPRYTYHWIDILTVICLGLIVKAIFLPIYYFFESFTVASIISAILYGVLLISSFTPLIEILRMEDHIIFNDLDQGIVPLVEKSIPFQPFFVLVIVSITIYLLSLKISGLIFSRKEF